MDAGLSTTGEAEAALEATAVVGDPIDVETRPRDLQEGVTVGRYVILESIGEGGMGKVYLAEDPELDRRVAIKILRTSRSEERLSSMSNRLLREAQAIAKLSHPNIVAVHDVGRCDSGVFIAMEYVRGQSLREWLDEKERNIDEVLDVFIAVARALGAAHEEGIVHRDIKPDNIRFDAKGRVKILDFGLARATIDVDLTAGDSLDGVDREEPIRPDSLLSAEMTQAGHVLGTPAYMSPEQYRGAVIVPASDQFSLCVTLFEAVYGQRPFLGASAEDLGRARELGASFPERASAPVAIRRVLQRGLDVLPQESASRRFARSLSSTSVRRTNEKVDWAKPCNGRQRPHASSKAWKARPHVRATCARGSGTSITKEASCRRRARLTSLPWSTTGAPREGGF